MDKGIHQMMQKPFSKYGVHSKTISTDIKERISTMGYLFVVEGLVDLSITATDSTLLKQKVLYGTNHP